MAGDKPFTVAKASQPEKAEERKHHLYILLKAPLNPFRTIFRENFLNFFLRSLFSQSSSYSTKDIENNKQKILYFHFCVKKSPSKSP